ncbi:MAG TPA: chorismate mutase [Nitrolancea sp.]|nr:chorismate mutase [Nitrolancea sp.]
MMRCRGIRGATTVERNTAEDILEATRELLAAITDANDLELENIASVIFTTSPDLDAAFPAVAARGFGWDQIALMCMHEIGVPGSLQQAIRVLIHYNTDKSSREIHHVYLRRAVDLRPDWAYRPSGTAQS